MEDKDELDDEEKDELAEAKDLIDEIGKEAECGVTLIHEADFEDYARELAEDIGAIGRSLEWPAYCIDWEWAARELKMDYSEIEYKGETYYYR